MRHRFGVLRALLAAAVLGQAALGSAITVAMASAWAHGEDGDDPDVLKELTFGLFWSALWVYDPDEPYFTYVDPQTGDATYDLTKLLQGTTPNMDCQDASGLLHLAAAACGIGSELTVLAPDVGGFWTNLLCGLGNDASQTGPYDHFPFAFHQVVSSNGAVYDAACAQLVDLSGNWYRNPPAGSAWALPGFWQTAAGDEFLGLTRCYGEWPMPGYEEVGLADTPVRVLSGVL